MSGHVSELIGKLSRPLYSLLGRSKMQQTGPDTSMSLDGTVLAYWFIGKQASTTAHSGFAVVWKLE